MKKTLSEVEAHTLNGDLECEVCGEWVPDFAVTLVKINKYDGHKNVCDTCIAESKEFSTCVVCGDTFHVDLMRDDEWCEDCFRKEQLSVEERTGVCEPSK